MGHVPSCALAAQKYAQGQWVPRDAAKAAKLTQRAAKLKDPTMARDHLERECDAGSTNDCYLLAEAYRTGSPAWQVPKDADRFRALIARACPANDGSVGCRVLDRLLAEQRSREAAKGPLPCDSDEQRLWAPVLGPRRALALPLPGKHLFDGDAVVPIEARRSIRRPVRERGPMLLTRAPAPLPMRVTQYTTAFLGPAAAQATGQLR